MIQLKHSFSGRKLIVLAIAVFLSATVAVSQTKPTPKPALNLPKVTKIDEAGLKAAIKPNGKPVLVNFWATWCDPCREEFPDLVQLDAEFKGRVDFVTISLDDPADIAGDVPQFLAEMKAEMPAYLLRVPDEGVVIATIAKDWQGGLPFTVLYDQNGVASYLKQGKFKTAILRAEIDKLIGKKPVLANDLLQLELPRSTIRSADERMADGVADTAERKLTLKL